MTLVKKEFREKLEHGNREKRATLKYALLWENGMIPYVFTGVYRGNLHYSSLATHAVSCSIMQYHAALCSIMQHHAVSTAKVAQNASFTCKNGYPCTIEDV